MGNFKEKAQVFIIGLSIGLLIAGAFFILKLDDYFKELSLYKKVSQTFSPVQQQKTLLKEEPEEKKAKKPDPRPLKNKPVSFADSTEAPAQQNVAAAATDSLQKRTDSTGISENTEDIVVRKDELLSTKTLDVFNLDLTANKPTSKDSLLQKVSGIKDDKLSGKQMFNIELWSSPLNYKGYKMSKYKMVLYGISSFDGIKLYKLDDVIYMKAAAAIYRLDYANDFKPYEHITDEQIINKLK